MRKQTLLCRRMLLILTGAQWNRSWLFGLCRLERTRLDGDRGRQRLGQERCERLRTPPQGSIAPVRCSSPSGEGVEGLAEAGRTASTAPTIRAACVARRAKRGNPTGSLVLVL